MLGWLLSSFTHDTRSWGSGILSCYHSRTTRSIEIRGAKAVAGTGENRLQIGGRSAIFPCVAQAGIINSPICRKMLYISILRHSLSGGKAAPIY